MSLSGSAAVPPPGAKQAAPAARYSQHCPRCSLWGAGGLGKLEAAGDPGCARGDGAGLLPAGPLQSTGEPSKAGVRLDPSLGFPPWKAGAEPVLQGGTGSASPRHCAGVLGRGGAGPLVRSAAARLCPTGLDFLRCARTAPAGPSGELRIAHGCITGVGRARSRAIRTSMARLGTLHPQL